MAKKTVKKSTLKDYENSRKDIESVLNYCTNDDAEWDSFLEYLREGNSDIELTQEEFETLDSGDWDEISKVMERVAMAGDDGHVYCSVIRVRKALFPEED